MTKNSIFALILFLMSSLSSQSIENSCNGKVSLPDTNKFLIEQNIKNINMIPGSGEFVYDTKIQTKIALSDDMLVQK